MKSSKQTAGVIGAIIVLASTTIAMAQTTRLFLGEPGRGAWLGISISDLNPDKVKELKLTDENGVLIDRVEKDSPAEKAGLKANDVIVQFNGIQVLTTSQFMRMIHELLPDRTVSLSVIRGNATTHLSVKLGERPHPEGSLPQGWEVERPREFTLPHTPDMSHLYDRLREFNFSESPMMYSFLGLGRGRLGINMESLTPQLGEYFGVKEGHGALVVSVEKDSPAEKAGLKAGDVITAIDSEEIKSPGDVMRTVQGKKEGNLEIKVLRDRQPKSFSAQLQKQEDERVPERPRMRTATRTRILNRASVI
ncbi:MAG: PDZ domain-containing protein [Acidobacteriia bacterium]|nr:PDZ domain-containing protein [Terriglobia bacterium]